MTVSLTHTTAATGSDSGDGKISKNAWNEAHTLEMATARILGRTTAGAGAVEEISVGTGLTLSAGSLAASNVSNTAYGSGWDGDTTTAPSKNAVYDRIEVNSFPEGQAAANVSSVFSHFLTTGNTDILQPNFASSTQNSGTVASTTESNLGIATFSTTTASNARASLQFNVTSILLVASGEVRIKGRIRIPDSLPDGTETYQVFFGYTATFGIPLTQMAGFLLRWTGAAVALEAVTRATGTQDTTALTVPSTSTWYVWEVVITGTTDAKYYIDGVLVATHTNLPTTVTSVPVSIVKSAGTTARRFQLDWFGVKVTRP